MKVCFKNKLLALALTSILIMSGCSSTEDKEGSLTDENTAGAGSGVQSGGRPQRGANQADLHRPADQLAGAGPAAPGDRRHQPGRGLRHRGGLRAPGDGPDRSESCSHGAGLQRLGAGDRGRRPQRHRLFCIRCRTPSAGLHMNCSAT